MQPLLTFVQSGVHIPPEPAAADPNSRRSSAYARFMLKLQLISVHTLWGELLVKYLVGRVQQGAVALYQTLDPQLTHTGARNERNQVSILSCCLFC
jgi:hypothetical protein